MPVVQEPTNDYRWVEPLEAYCFTAAVGIDPDEVIRRLGADPTETADRTFEECFWVADGSQWIQVGPVDGAVLIAEHNGWRAEEAIEALSLGARVACFFRNVQAIMHFVYAVDGRILAEFDPLLEARPASGCDPTVLDRALAGLRFGLFDAEPSAMSLLERVTGVRVRQRWLNLPQRAARLPPMV
jgi:hypothetical protein